MRVLIGVCMIMGCFLGAGFVSGREIASYFSRFGESSIYAIIVAILLLFVLIFAFLFLSSKVSNSGDFCRFYFGKFHKVVHFLMSISVLIVLGSMFAGTESLGETLDISTTLFVLMITILACFLIMGNINSLQKINLILIPFILVIVVFVTCRRVGECNFAGNIMYAIASGGNYVLINIVSLGMFLLEIGHKYTRKERILISIISSVVIGVMLFLINNAILDDVLIDKTFPTLVMASSSKILYICMHLSIFFGLFTTLISNALIFTNYLNTFIHSRFISCICTLGLGLILSLLGFKEIIGYVYWLIGLIGGVMLVVVIFKEKGTREPRANNIAKTSNMRNNY